MSVLNIIDKRLIEVGYNTLTPFEKNNLTARIAELKGILYNEVSEQVLLDYHKDIKIKQLSDMCEQTILEGFLATNGHTYRTNRDDQTNMIGQKDYLIDNPSVETVKWKTEDVGYIDHLRDEWLLVYLEGFSHKQTQLFKYDGLKKSVATAETHEEIVNVVWD
ncbi:hypothetical protein P4V41_07055 [Fictibacillus nanhaiensis]|uniref:DUF4376 domain-containing protein n=1 Tax=Fictibacillus nanhaiensis TaxID=742169 RepID=UPI002E1E3AAB|nr:hypothetical protein [Fictibacillus nanhaiensis]